MRLLTVLVALLFAGTASAEQWNPAQDLPVEIREWYRNIGYQGGSCVQMSLGMCGVDQNVPAAATLPFDSDYGKAILGGSGPSRVSNYCDERDIKAWNITGSDTFDWMRWACRNGRGCAIGAGTRHFQTLTGHDPRTGTWFVCNNNSPQRIDEYSEREFRNLHLSSGPWIVILDYPPHPPNPRYVAWWK